MLFYQNTMMFLLVWGTLEIELQKGAVPKRDVSRTVPIPIKDGLKNTLNENLMEKKGHLAKVHEPTDWVSSAVYVKKHNGKLHVWIPRN